VIEVVDQSGVLLSETCSIVPSATQSLGDSTALFRGVLPLSERNGSMFQVGRMSDVFKVMQVIVRSIAINVIDLLPVRRRRATEGQHYQPVDASLFTVSPGPEIAEADTWIPQIVRVGAKYLACTISSASTVTSDATKTRYTVNALPLRDGSPSLCPFVHSWSVL
jgi:hypothetical protein